MAFYDAFAAHGSLDFCNSPQGATWPFLGNPVLKGRYLTKGCNFYLNCCQVSGYKNEFGKNFIVSLMRFNDSVKTSTQQVFFFFYLYNLNLCNLTLLIWKYGSNICLFVFRLRCGILRRFENSMIKSIKKKLNKLNWLKSLFILLYLTIIIS